MMLVNRPRHVRSNSPFSPASSIKLAASRSLRPTPTAPRKWRQNEPHLEIHVAGRWPLQHRAEHTGQTDAVGGQSLRQGRQAVLDIGELHSGTLRGARSSLIGRSGWLHPRETRWLFSFIFRELSRLGLLVSTAAFWVGAFRLVVFSRRCS